MRARCAGLAPLSGRLEQWQTTLCEQPDRLADWLERYGSPLNFIAPVRMGANAAELRRVAVAHGLDFRIYFARKANKALALVDEARRLGLGVDLASERELRQAIQRGVAPENTIMTAAIKTRELLSLCVASGTTVAIDNADELGRLASLAEQARRSVPIAMRLAPRLSGRPQTRFGLDLDQMLELVDAHWSAGRASPLRIAGIHFHLDGYAASERVSALGECVALIDRLRDRGHRPSFIDIGGGVPVSYIDSAAEWETFWREHHRGLLGQREPLTFGAHPLGLSVHDGEIGGAANVYPYHQRPTGGDWLAQILEAPIGGSGGATVAESLRARDLQLRCEPGRALLDGCGLTAARVEFRKQRRDGAWLIGLAMNRTQCRSTSDDFLVDPLLLRPGGDGADSEGPSRGPEPIEGFLLGAYCIERELLT
ncbi:MAG TPA: hypothetical protein VH025_08900, partial [Solirubrobacteraceae bacterium]|nr:hypothetical protein [Solirubrobacteraceae bacterium]